MKEPFESSEAFTAYSTVAAGMYMLKELQDERNKPIPPISIAVDKATGYDKVRQKKWYEKLEIILVDMIEAKKFLEDDFYDEEQMLALCQSELKKE